MMFMLMPMLTWNRLRQLHRIMIIPIPIMLMLIPILMVLSTRNKQTFIQSLTKMDTYTCMDIITNPMIMTMQMITQLIMMPMSTLILTSNYGHAHRAEEVDTLHDVDADPDADIDYAHTAHGIENVNTTTASEEDEFNPYLFIKYLVLHYQSMFHSLNTRYFFHPRTPLIHPMHLFWIWMKRLCIVLWNLSECKCK